MFSLIEVIFLSEIIKEKKLLLIMNPCSGTKRANKFLTDILVMFGKGGYNYQVFMTEKSGDAKRIAREYAGYYDLIVAIGGDGTFNEVVSGVLKSKSKTPIGYIPAGSTNDFANSLKMSKNILNAARDILNGNVAELDIGSFNGRTFSYVASFGAFTEASYKTPQNIKNTFGHAAYLLSGIKDIGTIKSKKIKFNADGNEIYGDFIFGAVCNSTSVGGILTLDSKVVDMSDGVFELLLIRRPKDLFELNEIVVALSSKKYDTKMITFLSAKTITAETDEDVNWTLDGEYAYGEDKIEIKNLNKAIKVIIPKKQS